MSASAIAQRWESAASESANAASQQERRYELCFRSFADPSFTFAFPCDADGRVDLDALSDEARHDYLYARTVIGRVFRPPAVRAH